jgi:hypothetical protein
MINESEVTKWPWGKVSKVNTGGGGGGDGGDGEPSGEAADALDNQTDNHEVGQEEAKKDGLPTEETPTEQDIDNNDKRVEGAAEDRKDQTPDERPSRQAPQEQPADHGVGPGGKGGRDPTGKEVDYSKIMPSFTWAVLAKRFLMAAAKHTEETYMKPARRGVSGLETLQQTGAAAIKPAEVPREQNDAKLLFCFDSSGSMTPVIDKVFVNAVNLLRMPAYRNSEVLVLKYSGNYTIFRANFARNQAAIVPDVKTKPKRYDLTAKSIFSEHIGGGTDLSAAIANQLIKALQTQWNVLIFIDSDNLYGENFVNLSNVIRAKPNQTFIIFDTRQTYISFRQKFGGTTPNITYFKD